MRTSWWHLTIRDNTIPPRHSHRLPTTTSERKKRKKNPPNAKRTLHPACCKNKNHQNYNNNSNTSTDPYITNGNHSPRRTLLSLSYGTGRGCGAAVCDRAR